MAFIDYYQILGITKKATEKEVKAAYRKLARKFHPDVNPNDKDAHKKFQEINEANEVLSNSDNRKKYDQHGKDWKYADQYQQTSQQQQSKNQGEQPYSGNFSNENFSEFFSSMFGGQSGNTSRSSQVKFKGQDFNTEFQLKLRDAYQTHQQTFNVNGKNIRITVPAGIENGQTIKIAGHGGSGINNGPNGDLYITFSIDNDPQFKRLGNDLYISKEIDLFAAVLGAEITIETMNGKVKLNVKPETQNGTKVKLKGKGFPVYKKENEFGDLYVTYNIKIPTNLSDKQKELFTELSEYKPTNDEK